MLEAAAKAIRENRLHRSIHEQLSQWVVKRGEAELGMRLKKVVTSDPRRTTLRILEWALGEGEFGFRPEVERPLTLTLCAFPTMRDTRTALGEVIMLSLRPYVFEEMERREIERHQDPASE